MAGWLFEETSREMSPGFYQDSLLFLVSLVINSSHHRADAVLPLSRARKEHPHGPVTLATLPFTTQDQILARGRHPPLPKS